MQWNGVEERGEWKAFTRRGKCGVGLTVRLEAVLPPNVPVQQAHIKECAGRASACDQIFSLHYSPTFICKNQIAP